MLDIISELSNELYSPSVIAKLWGIASLKLGDKYPPSKMPEYTDPETKEYVYTSVDFWTSGFFPGSLYLLLERMRRFPKTIPNNVPVHPLKLLHACKWWSENLHKQAARVDTHDLGFMIEPAMIKDYELTGDKRSLNTLITAARSLASRFNEKKRYSFSDPSKDFLVIIDNMLNLDLLYYVAALTGEIRLSTIATSHAEVTLKHHIRHPVWSTFHVVNFNEESGTVKEKITNQGYQDYSTWSRGQAWGILGFAKVYKWTKQSKFLTAAIRLGDYFFQNLPEDGVPPWDFDAPQPTYRDTSAAMIAANGYLSMFENTNENEYLRRALYLIKSTLKTSLSPRSRFANYTLTDEVEMGDMHTILDNATINNHEFAPRKWADHGLVYADYYFMENGNLLAKLGLVEHIS
ncbi:Six-hairpin glycosidase-like protein [Lipomyces starkeyi]|uniref:Glycoside hydrolase family 88 protein n=1 Tax=Lipomyces starkeyi NRRL Y-11557 TaxID=675824 RepID=A0A1E3PUX5_LIPST|nr:hypothetical protein LIPSTDRAFT_108178 [Lipomyces starkeyi NRRL Y-11557]